MATIKCFDRFQSGNCMLTSIPWAEHGQCTPTTDFWSVKALSDRFPCSTQYWDVFTPVGFSHENQQFKRKMSRDTFDSARYLLLSTYDQASRFCTNIPTTSWCTLCRNHSSFKPISPTSSELILQLAYRKFNEEHFRSCGQNRSEQYFSRKNTFSSNALCKSAHVLPMFFGVSCTRQAKRSHLNAKCQEALSIQRRLFYNYIHSVTKIRPILT